MTQEGEPITESGIYLINPDGSGLTKIPGTVYLGGHYGLDWQSKPSDTTPPKVMRTSPGNGATQKAPGVNVTATFSEAMDASTTDGDPSTINSTTFKLMKVGTTSAIGAVVSYDATANKAILNPNANLQLGTKYQAVVTTGAQDLVGNRLDQNPNLGRLTAKGVDLHYQKLVLRGEGVWGVAVCS